MDRILKFLKKLTSNEREKIGFLMENILFGKMTGLKVKKLVGLKDLYRVREGKIRIVFRKEQNGNVIVNVDYRKDIYRN